jgi:hypothetical protein
MKYFESRLHVAAHYGCFPDSLSSGTALRFFIAIALSLKRASDSFVKRMVSRLLSFRRAVAFLSRESLLVDIAKPGDKTAVTKATSVQLFFSFELTI